MKKNTRIFRSDRRVENKKMCSLKGAGNRILSLVLAIAVIVSFTPFTAQAAQEPGTFTLRNDYVEAVVSKENGGFLIRTAEGNKLIKDDNNKNLLYHNGQYDTSFTSFRVEYADGTVREVIFGGSYGFLGLSSSDVVVTQDQTGITAVWSVDDLTFTQRLELSAMNSNEHGMASISYTVKNNGSTPVKGVKARVLLDSCLGNRDYAFYQIPVDSVGGLETVQKEKVFEYAPDSFVPATLYAINDAMTPGITAYTVNSTAPYRIAFGHWNNLASTLFDFAPDTTLEFTNPYNASYLTADSAYALYYDLGDIEAESAKNISTYYGVYSNAKTSAGDEVTVNITAPTSLELSANRKEYLPSNLAVGGANIGVETKINNFVKEVTADYAEITVALYTPKGITPMDEGGNDTGRTYSYSDPYAVTLSDVKQGQARALTFQMKADVGSSVAYRKIEIRAFSTSDATTPGSMLTEQNLLGSASFYVLCPGGDGELPKVTFTGGDPDILYYKGTRHFFVTGNNFSMLADKSLYTLYLQSLTDTDRKVLIEPDHITFPENPEGNIMNVIVTQELPVGDYQLVYHWEDAAVTNGIIDQRDKVMTAPALRVVMSDDPAFKNDTYGVAIVYQKPGTSSHTAAYEIKTFRDEAGFAQFKANSSNYEEILIVLRGGFDVDTKGLDGNPVSWTATVGKAALENGKVNQNTIVSLNNCIDFENGTLTVHYEDNDPGTGKILVDFDGDLYTSVARTGIWKGKAALTAIENGTEFSLVPYDKNGKVRPLFNDNTITLVWPCALSMAQTLSGMVFNMTYGKLGVMLDETDPSNPVELGRVLAFSANMDLSFLVPSGSAAKGSDTKWNRIRDAFSLDSDYLSLRSRYDRFVEEPSEQDKQNMQAASGQASVMVDNILFGCGTGYIGFQCEVGVKLPAYTQAMPTMSCNLKINTIGDWSFGVKGACKFTTIEMEVDIDIRSKNNIPVPNKLYFYIAGFEPGINVDGCGVLWITGGGGGIDNLYDTIFAGSTIPPLKILLSVTFDIIKVLSARVDMGLGLRGLSLNANSVKIKFTEIVVLERAGLQFDWYPDWYFQASVKMNLLGVINGAGYIVVVDNAQFDKFFEFYVRAGLMIPSYIPIVGGIEVGGVDLGVNNEKLWGAAKIIGIKFGITYYWAGDFDWGTGKGSEPTFPGLLGYESVPVYYDDETGQTLCMTVGTNLSVLAQSGIGQDPGSAPRLLGIGSYVFSSGDKKIHELNLGTYDPNGEVFTITYDAADLDDAGTKANAMTISDGTLDYGVNYGINANVTYDPDTGKGTLAISATEAAQFDKAWHINTVVPADIILYSVAAIPEITDVSCSVSGNTATVNWTGSETDKLDRLDFYLTADTGTKEQITDMGMLAGSLNNGEIIAATTGMSGTTSFTLPGTLQTGDYYIRVVYKREDTVNGSLISGSAVHYENADQPAAPDGIVVTNGGDCKLNVSVANNTNTDYDTYVLNVYEKDPDGDWVLSDVNAMTYEKQEQLDESGSGTGVMLPVTGMAVGGAYQGFDKDGNPVVYGLTAGKPYRVGVTAVKNVNDASGNHLYQVAGTETLSDEIILTVPTPPEVAVANTSPFTAVERWEWDEGGSLVNHTYDTSKSGEVAFTIGADVPITGTWDVDGTDTHYVQTDSRGLSGSFTSVSAFDINISALKDGDHTLTVWGTDEEGDCFRVQKVFTVDTQPPKLLITSPLNGGIFNENGLLIVSGVTDKDALFSISVDGNEPAAAYRNKTVSELGGTIDSDGVFRFSVHVDPGKSVHRVMIIAKDQVGNFMRHEGTVKNGGLADINSLDLYRSDGSSAPVCYSNKNLPISPVSPVQAVFSLVAVTESGRQIIIDDEALVEWTSEAVKGTANIDENGFFTAGADSIGYVTGNLKVSSRGAMTAAATFGAERYTGGYSVVLGSAIGGTVTGDGFYKPGETVTIQAIPNTGYRFSRWTAAGVTLTSNTAKTTFIMPSHDVTVTAEFVRISEPTKPDSGSGSGSPVKITVSRHAEAGERVVIDLGKLEMDLSACVPYYKDSKGDPILVPMSVTEGGKLIFIAPVKAEYYVMENKVSFTDIDLHWAKEAILYSAARGIFKGIGNEQFDPEGNMTRAMLVTVLHRLAGSPAAEGNLFTDVESDSWYTGAVAWASQNGVVNGYGNGKFGPADPITREQLVVILYRYIGLIDNDPDEAFTEMGRGSEKLFSGFTDAERMSPWAKDAMEWAVRIGIINGIGETLSPDRDAARAQCCTMLMRFIRLILLGKV